MNRAGKLAAAIESANDEDLRLALEALTLERVRRIAAIAECAIFVRAADVPAAAARSMCRERLTGRAA